MAELEDKISSILSNPAALEQVMGIVRALSPGAGSGEKPAAEAAVPTAAATQAPSPAVPASSGAPDLSGILSALSGGKTDKQPLTGLDPKMSALLVKLLGTYAGQDGKQAALLNALKPYVSGQRRDNIDKAQQIIRIAKVARQALEGIMGGESDV